MGRSRKFDYQAAIISGLGAHPDGLTLDQLLERAGLEVDRSTLFRHMTRLIQSGSVQRTGRARASRYRLASAPETGAAPAAPEFTEIRIPPPASPLPEFRRPDLPSAPERPEPAPAPPQRPFGAPAPSSAQTEAGPDRAPGLPAGYDAIVQKAVRTAVRDWKRCDRVNLRIYLSLLAKPEHLDLLAAAVQRALAGLHQGNLAEFGLSPDEFSQFIPPAPAAGGDSTEK